MSSLLKMLSQQLGSEHLEKIGNQAGVNRQSTSKAISVALPLLIDALARNASDKRGAGDLSKALSRDHDGEILNNLSRFFENPNMGDGQGILGHVLGANKTRVETGISKSSGLDAESVGKILTILAPVVLGALGKAKRERNLDAQSLGSYLGQEREELKRNEPMAMGILGQLLDTDGDGDLDISDITRHGVGLLGKFLKK